MKRSIINTLVRSAKTCFVAHGWTLPPSPRWDVTDFGLGDWQQFGLVLVNLAEEPEYCEKLARGISANTYAGGGLLGGTAICKQLFPKKNNNNKQQMTTNNNQQLTLIYNTQRNT